MPPRDVRSHLMRSRRHFLATVVLVTARPSSLLAQPAAPVPRIGLLIHQRSPASPPTPEQMARTPLVQGLRAHGWIVGENVKLEPVFSEGQSERLPDLAAELVSRQVDVIWCLGPPAAVAAARATKTMPIVFWGVGFPVELGLVASFARPGGNVTGMAHTPGPEIITKLFQLIKTIVPSTTRVLAMFEASAVRKVNGDIFLPLEIVDAAIRHLKMDLRRIPLKDPADVDRELAGIRDWRPEAIMVVGDPVTIIARQRITGFAIQQRIPAVFGMRDFALAGGLLSYGPNTADTVRQSASYLAQILKGVKPADLPVEQPTRFELLVNLKTAREIGITVPQSVLVRADEVIE